MLTSLRDLLSVSGSPKFSNLLLEDCNVCSSLYCFTIKLPGESFLPCRYTFCSSIKKKTLPQIFHVINLRIASNISLGVPREQITPTTLDLDLRVPRKVKWVLYQEQQTFQLHFLKAFEQQVRPREPPNTDNKTIYYHQSDTDGRITEVDLEF